MEKKGNVCPEIMPPSHQYSRQIDSLYKDSSPALVRSKLLIVFNQTTNRQRQDTKNRTDICLNFTRTDYLMKYSRISFSVFPFVSGTEKCKNAVPRSAWKITFTSFLLSTLTKKNIFYHVCGQSLNFRYVNNSFFLILCYHLH